MKQKLSRFEYIRSVIAKWIIINIAFKISRIGVISLCLEMSKLYTDSIEVNDKE